MELINSTNERCIRCVREGIRCKFLEIVGDKIALHEDRIEKGEHSDALELRREIAEDRKYYRPDDMETATRDGKLPYICRQINTIFKIKGDIV